MRHKYKEEQSEHLKQGGGIPIAGEDFTSLLKSVLDKKADFRFKAKGFSMLPFIRDGDILTLSPLNNFSVSAGHIVAFIHPCNKKLVIHRVLGRCKCGGHYIIKGDNVPGIDGAISREYIIGYVKKVERGKRSISLGLGRERLLVVFLSKIDFSRGLFFLWRLIPFSLQQKIKRLV